MTKIKEFLLKILVGAIVAIPAAFVKQCSKNADQIEFRQSYGLNSSDWKTSSGTFDNFNKIHWVNSTDLPHLNKKNEVVVNYDEGLIFLDEEMPNSIRLISSVPDTPQSFNNIFSRNPSVADMDDVNTTLKKLSSTQIKGSYISSKNSEDFLAGISNSDEKTIIILGHNDNGFLKFSDGSELSISNISLQCKKNQKYCVFISCKSKSFLDQDSLGLDYNIILSDAVILVRYLIKNIQRSESTSFKEIDTYLTDSVSKVHFYNGAKVTVKLGFSTGTASLLMYEIKISNDEKDSSVVSYAISLFTDISYYYDDLDQKYNAYSELVSQFGGSNNLELQRLITLTKIRQSIILSQQDRFNESIEILDSLIDRYKKLERMEDQKIFANLLYSKAGVYWSSKNFHLSISEYDNLITRFLSSEEDEISYIVAQAMLNKAHVLNDIGLPDEEIVIYDKVVKRFGSLEKVKYQHFTAQALFRKATRLTKLGRFEESLRTYDYLIEKYKVLTDDFMGAEGYTSVAERGEYWAYFGDHKLKDEITEYVISSLGNSTEISFFIESSKDTMSRAEKVLSKVSTSDDNFLIYEFFIYAAKRDSATRSRLCHSISSLEEQPKLSWDFREIDLLMVEMSDEEKSELSQFVSFLKGEIDKTELRSVCNTQQSMH